jgi:two-component system KDP operon response regulator KdpE
MRVLIVEDEKGLAESMRRGLVGEGFVVDVFHDGVDGLWAASEFSYDVAILDIMLPGMNGYQVLKEVRDREIWTPVIMLTAKDGEYDQTDAFDLGADDYLTKPFSMGELLARIRVALRHAGTVAGQDKDGLFAVGGLEVDLPHRRVRIDGNEVHLTPIEYRLLTALVRQSGKVLTHRQLLKDVWGPSHVEHHHYLRIYMSGLRHKLEQDPARPRYLLTESGVGYRLAAE